MDIREKLSSGKRLIDANALGIGRCSKDILPPDYCASWNGVINLIEKAPTIDAVPVVRCRECKYYDTADFDGDILCGCTLHSAMVDITPDSFCSCGERKEGTE